MNQKYLLSMLFGGVMLTACSVDDEFNAAKVSQDVNPEAPVFAISFEGDANPMTRATFNGDQVVYQQNDLMSLYHGITEWTAYQNAVYKYSDEDEEGVVKWNTAAMVQKGTAIMMYPADTKFDNEAPNAPLVKIEEEQTKDNLVEFPYMSAVMNIADMKEETNKDKTEGVSGYGKEYKIKMKPAASVLNFVLSVKNDKEINDALKAAGVEKEIEVTGVTLDNGSTELFTTSIPVKIGDAYDDGKFSNDYPYWTKRSELNTSDVKAKATSISSICKIDNTHLSMAVLPFASTVDEKSFDDMVMKVETTYGSVEITAEGKEVLPNKTMRDKYQTGETPDLSNVFGKVVLAEVKGEAGSTTFKNEYAGQKISLQVTVDLSKVNMSEKHVKTGEEMHDMLKVLNALKGQGEDEYESALYLDGVDGVFEMNEEQLQALIDQQKNEKVKVKFVPCKEDGLKKIVITNTTGKAIDLTDFGFDDDNIPVELVGEWNFDTNADATKAIKLGKITSLTVAEGGVLNLKGTIQVNSGDATSLSDDASDFGLIIAKGGNVVVEEDVLLSLNTKNEGTITIGKTNKSAALTVTGAKKLENSEAVVDDDANWAVYGETACGVIDNYGSLSSDFNVANSVINNYGVINVLDEKAMTLVTANAAATIDFASPFSATNKIGSIYLYNETGSGYRTSVGTATAQGFIKLVVKGNKLDSSVGDVANYIVVDETAGAEEINDLNFNDSKVKYLEIKKDLSVKKGSTLNLDALIVKGNNTTLNVPSNESIKLAEAVYNEGIILFAGKLIEPNNKNVWRTTETIFGTSTGAMRSNGGQITKE